MKHKLLTIHLAALLALASWANGTNIDGIYYLLYSNTQTASVTYTGTGSNNNKTKYSIGNITIPSSITYDGMTYSVTRIGEYAFQDCTRMTSITIPESVTRIGDNAFNSCI